MLIVPQMYVQIAYGSNSHWKILNLKIALDYHIYTHERITIFENKQTKGENQFEF